MKRINIATTILSVVLILCCSTLAAQVKPKKTKTTSEPKIEQSVVREVSLDGKASTGTVATERIKNPYDVLLEVGKEKFTVGQIAEAFRKNAGRSGKTFTQLTYDSAADFVNIYAIYRLKVQAALEAGLDKNAEVLHDLESNRQQLAVPAAPGSGYLVERKVVDPGVDMIFKRRADELKLAIIFVSMRPNDAVDTLRAYRKASTMLTMLKAGQDFGRMASDSSDDPGTKATAGVLPSYITGGMIIRPIEEAAYTVKTGELYPELVRVPAGYVIVKSLERIPRIKMRAGHILFEVTFTDTTAEGKKNAAEKYAKAEQALARIKAGEDFKKVAKEVSDDKVSSENGGDFLSYYTRSLGFEAKRGKLVPEFEAAMFQLKPGEVSGIIKSPFGYHIVKNFDSRRPTIEEERETLKQVFRQQYLPDERAVYVRNVLIKQGLEINEGTLAAVLGRVNQNGSTTDTTWSKGIDAGTRAQTLFRFHGKEYSVATFIDSVRIRRDLSATPLTRSGVTLAIQSMVEQEAMVLEAQNLEKDYPEFASLMQEFRDGILIFKLEEQKVWSNPAYKFDSAQAVVYFNANRDQYKTDPQVAITEVFVYKEQNANALYATAISGTTPFDTIAAQNTERPGYRQNAGHWKLSTAKDADIVQQVLKNHPDAKPGDIFRPFAYQGGFSIVRIDRIEAPHPMTYDEAKNDLMSHYMDSLQKKLTSQWIEELKAKYGVKINHTALKQAMTSK